MPTHTRSLLVLVSALALAAPGLARAEFFVDMHMGGAFTEDGDLKLGNGGISAKEETSYKSSVSAGARAGYWLDALPWLGAAITASYYNPDDDQTGGAVQIHVIPVTALLMLRAPLAKSASFPEGRVFPYVGAGPGAFVSHVDIDAFDYEDTTVDIGADVRAGLSVDVLPRVSTFLEYRFTYTKTHWQDGLFTSNDVDLDAELATHHFGLGIGFRF